MLQRARITKAQSRLLLDPPVLLRSDQLASHVRPPLAQKSCVASLSSNPIIEGGARWGFLIIRAV